MTREQVFNLKSGDYVAYRGGVMLIKSNSGSEIVFQDRSRTFKRAMGQVLKFRNTINLVEGMGETEHDLLFYDPASNNIIEVSKGSLFLGRL